MLQCYNAMYKKMAKELIKKQRILVPDAAMLIGVVDEYDVLEEGQVYINLLSKDPKTGNESEQKITNRHVMVIKNPCLHPGDLRRLYAVDRPELSHLYNCIVFPRVGSRPHTTEISGSDLDGDNFFAYWDEQLILEREYEPFNFPETQSGEREQVTQDDVINFWLEFIQNDSLGIIANSHAALADFEPQKALDHKCL